MKYTKEMEDFLEKTIKEYTYKETAILFKEKFGIDKNYKTLQNLCQKRGFKTGRSGQFKKGHNPYNKGKNLSPEHLEKLRPTLFQKGNTPHLWTPIGTIRPFKGNYLYIKLADNRKCPKTANWKSVHKAIWEKHHKKEVPDGYTIIFADKNNRNFDIDNLVLVSRAELMQMNKKKLIYEDAELTKAGHLIAKIELSKKE